MLVDAVIRCNYKDNYYLPTPHFHTDLLFSYHYLITF